MMSRTHTIDTAVHAHAASRIERLKWQKVPTCPNCGSEYTRTLDADLCCTVRTQDQPASLSLDVAARLLGRRLGGIL